MPADPRLPLEQFQAQRGVCRYCKCTGRGCAVPARSLPGVTVPCGWADVRWTFCTNPECLKHYRSLGLDTLRAMVRRHCFCGRQKSVHKVLCPACWEQLPYAMGAPLFEPISHGLSVYYAEAVAYLTALRALDDVQPAVPTEVL